MTRVSVNVNLIADLPGSSHIYAWIGILYTYKAAYTVCICMYTYINWDPRASCEL